MYLADFASGSSYRYLGLGLETLGATSDLTHVVLGEDQALSEWVNGNVVPVGVANDGEWMSAGVGGQAQYGQFRYEKDAWRALSSDGSRVLFTSVYDEDGTGTEQEEGNGTLFDRVNSEQPQSALATPEAYVTGTLTQGSTTVQGLAPVFAVGGQASLSAGSNAITVVDESGMFSPGQPISGAGIPAGTVILAVAGQTLTLSNPASAGGEEVPVEATHPYAFTVGQRITGYGIRLGTTVTGSSSGTLTLSAPAAVSASAVALIAGGECTEPQKACTLDVSATQKREPDDQGLRTAKYVGASSDGSRVFFSSRAELTEDAYTGPEDNAYNLYEYDLQDARLTDLTVDATDVAQGAALQGVVAISEDGSYVYFVAGGDLATGATSGEPNLYVVHDAGAPKLIATLEASDGGTGSIGWL